MLNTHCKDCVFARYDHESNNQIGCSLKRPQKLKVKELKDNAFVLQRFCNTHRPEEWVETLSFEERLSAEEAALKEVRPRMGFFVRLNTSASDAISDLHRTLQSIKNMDGGPAYVVVITDKVEYNEEIWGLFITCFGEKSKSKYHIVQVTDTPEEVMLLVDEAFAHAQNGWIMTVTSGEQVDLNMLNKLNTVINVEMRQIIMIEPSGNFSGLVFPAYLFKFLNGNKTKIFQDEMVDGRGFIEKVKDAERRGGTNTVMTWEEFYAA
jgi:hypothetical protein